MKFNQSIDNDNNHVDYQGLKMTTMESTLIAVYRKSPNYPEETYFQISTLSESGWSEPIYLNISNGEITYNTEEVIAVDERHVAISAWSLGKKTLYIVNVETANVVFELPTSWDHETDDSTFQC